MGLSYDISRCVPSLPCSQMEECARYKDRPSGAIRLVMMDGSLTPAPCPFFIEIPSSDRRTPGQAE